MKQPKTILKKKGKSSKSLATFSYQEVDPESQIDENLGSSKRDKRERKICVSIRLNWAPKRTFDAATTEITLLIVYIRT